MNHLNQSVPISMVYPILKTLVHKGIPPESFFENMDIEDVKKQLDDLGVKYAHNTGEAKLREKLKDAING